MWKLFIPLIVLFSACTGQPEKPKDVAMADSTLRVSIDESFEPIMREQIKVFESSYPQTKVIAEYKPEAECLRDLEKDSARIVIISRELSRDETAYFDKKIQYKPSFEQLAEDAVAVVVNKSNPDSVFTIKELRQMLSGVGNKGFTVAIDGNTATSTVRYLKDSVLKGASFGKNVTGAKNSGELINYIANSEKAIGFVGISWVTDPQSPEQEAALQKVRMALIECQNCDKDVYAKPTQQTITFNQYPLVRGLYYVLNENYPGLGSRFINFLSTERGQLIFKRALLVPKKMNFNRRTIS